jgi:hypothetical protein
MDGLRARRVKDGRDVMPGIRGETLQRNAGSFPLLRGVVEYPPSVARVVGLPGEVVSVAVGGLLTFELDCLGIVYELSGNVHVKVVTEVRDWVLDCRLLDEVVAACVGWSAIHVEVRGMSTEARIGNALRHVIVRTLSRASDVSAATAGLPSSLILNAGDHNRRRGRWIGLGSGR